MTIRTAWRCGAGKCSSRARMACIARRTGPDRKVSRRNRSRCWRAFPAAAGHNSRTVGVGPDGRVYVSLGIQGNCSDQYLGERYPFDERRGGIFVLREDGGQPRWEAYRFGTAQSRGFCLASADRVMYASNNGPDHLGLRSTTGIFQPRHRRVRFTACRGSSSTGNRLKRDDCAPSRPPRPLAEVAVPVATFPSRNAPMGVAFVPTGAMGKALEHDAVVALRGSWGTQADPAGFVGSCRHAPAAQAGRGAVQGRRGDARGRSGHGFSAARTASAGPGPSASPSAPTARSISPATARPTACFV